MVGSMHLEYSMAYGSGHDVATTEVRLLGEIWTENCRSPRQSPKSFPAMSCARLPHPFDAPAHKGQHVADAVTGILISTLSSSWAA